MKDNSISVDQARYVTSIVAKYLDNDTVSRFIQSQCQMSIYYNYAPYGSIVFVLSYVGDCVNWYTSEALGKWFVDTLGKRFHVNFLGYAHWFM